MTDVVTRTIDNIVESVTISFEPAEIQARYLSVDIEITERLNEIGVANYGVYVPRLWSGYWYLTNNESIIDFGSIQWTRQRVYQKEFQGFSTLINRMLLGNAIAWQDEISWENPFIPNPTEPFLGMLKASSNVNKSVMDYLARILDCGFSLAHLVSDLRLYVPVGASFKVKIHHQPYCELGAMDVQGEIITIEDNPQKPLEPINPPLDVVPPPNDFEDIARDRDWIRPNECPTPDDAINDLIENDDPLKKFLVSFRVFNSSGVLTQTTTNRVFYSNRMPAFEKLSGQVGTAYYSSLVHIGISYASGSKTAFGTYPASSSATVPTTPPSYGKFFVHQVSGSSPSNTQITYIVDSVVEA